MRFFSWVRARLGFHRRQLFQGEQALRIFWRHRLVFFHVQPQAYLRSGSARAKPREQKKNRSKTTGNYTVNRGFPAFLAS